MSLYKGNNLISGVMPNSANQSLSNLNSAGQDKFDAKADVDLANVTDTGYIKMAGASMPSSTYTNLTLGASGTTYTAPANGWFFVEKIANSTLISDIKYVTLGNNTSGFQFQHNGAYQFALSAFIPVKKGDEVWISYNATGNTNAFKFIYATGSESEVI